ncbi:TOBE domain-containing protein [Streptomyces parvulus]|uniref:TOBE domain-containing protein n=1 Tax=Streptomyces parvulus TaxID=146923 RepID=UPI0036BE81AD
MPTYSIGQAARLLRVSPETVRRWADAGRLPMGRDGSGNRVIDGAGLAQFVRERAGGEAPDEASRAPVPVGNALTGIVTGVRLDGVVARVEVQAGPHRIASLVTREAVEDLGLAVGVTVTARMTSSDVHVEVPEPAARRPAPYGTAGPPTGRGGR